MKDPYYQKDLGSVWGAAFDELTDAASRVMMLVCLLAPADIPEHIFSEGEKLPLEYNFLNHIDQLVRLLNWRFVLLTVWSYDEAKLELANLSLILLNGDASLISINRSIQEAYLDRMSEEDYRVAFKVVVELLQGSFSRDAGRHLYTRWELCSSLIQHIQAFGEKYILLGGSDFFQPYEPLTYLIQNAAWFDVFLIPFSLNITNIKKGTFKRPALSKPVRN